MTRTQRVLLIGYGNPARLDDGLGLALASAVEGLRLPDVTVDADYQLTVEDAAAAAEHDVVIFADAASEGPEPFAFYPIEPKAGAAFSNHSVAPEAVLALAEQCFDARPAGYVLAIRGYEFDRFEEALTGRAEENLAAAVAFMKETLRERSFSRAGKATSTPADARPGRVRGEPAPGES